MCRSQPEGRTRHLFQDLPQVRRGWFVLMDDGNGNTTYGSWFLLRRGGSHPLSVRSLLYIYHTITPCEELLDSRLYPEFPTHFLPFSLRDDSRRSPLGTLFRPYRVREEGKTRSDLIRENTGCPGLVPLVTFGRGSVQKVHTTIPKKKK